MSKKIALVGNQRNFFFLKNISQREWDAKEPLYKYKAYNLSLLHPEEELLNNIDDIDPVALKQGYDQYFRDKRKGSKKKSEDNVDELESRCEELETKNEEIEEFKLDIYDVINKLEKNSFKDRKEIQYLKDKCVLLKEDGEKKDRYINMLATSILEIKEELKKLREADINIIKHCNERISKIIIE